MSDKYNLFLQFNDFIQSLKSPCVITDHRGKIVFANTQFSSKYNTLVEQNITKLFNISFDKLTEQKWAKVDDKLKLILHEINIGGENHYLIFVEMFNGLNYSESDFKLLNHDLNNTFTSILNSSVMLKQSVTEDNLLHYFTGIENGVTRASSMLDSFLSPEMKLSTSNLQIDLVVLIKEVIGSLNNFNPESIKINFSYSDSIFICGDYNKIFRAIQNICINSIEAIKDTGKIEITLLTNIKKKSRQFLANKQYVKISVKDSGGGITKTNLKKIFDKGFSTKDKNRESGLGLSSIKEIVEQHNGFIEVKSKLAVGTEFILYFPLHKIVEQKIAAAAKKINILVADDEENILELLNDLFLSYNYNVTPAKNGSEVIEILNKDGLFDILVIDRKMPVLDGIECIKKIKEMRIKLKIILTTGSPSIRLDMKQLKKYGVVEVLSKPYDFNYLLELIRGIVSVI